MKTALILLMSIFGASAQADESFCKGKQEAQIIAKITEKETDTLTYCRAKISMMSVKFFSENGLCPLTLPEIIDEGILFPLQNGHDCEIGRGQEISGVLVKKSGQITLE